MQSSELSQKRAEDVTVEIQDDHLSISHIQERAKDVTVEIQDDHLSISHIQERAEDVTVEVRDDHHSISLIQGRAEAVTVGVQFEHQSVSVELGQERAAVADVIQGGHQSILVSDDRWIEEVTKSLNKCRQKTQGRWPCTIFKVPEDIRQLDMKAYDPLVVTIGPYHYDTPQDRTVRAMQTHKWHCMRRLISRHTKSRRKATDLLGKCLMAMKEMDADVRGCYSEDLGHLSARELALIMLLDGCFIIHVLLRSYWSSDEEDDDDYDDNQEEGGIAAGHKVMLMLDVMGKKKIDFRVAAEWRVQKMMLFDLVKVENQIPFVIIRTLFNELKTPRDKNIDLVKIARDLLSQIHPSRGSKSAMPKINQVHHLLHLFHSTIAPSDDCLKNNSTEQEMDNRWIPSARELQLAGVEFVSKKECAGSFLDILFQNPVIEIPQLSLYDDTKTLLRNLIAFEQCYPKTNNYLTSYVFFMDYMINTAEDVELFELKGILINELGSADAAAIFINQLGQRIHDPGNNYLRGSIVRVQNYYKSKWHKNRARLMRDYFDNPWAFVSLVAAVILLLLTVQQSFFTAYAYFRPPKN